MAERRMFSKTIIDSDAFVDMPISAQALYFHLNMRADDDGFINSPRKIQRMIGASEDDLKILIERKFLIMFESGVVVIKHWKINNFIRQDRYKGTVYQDEFKCLDVKGNNAYTLFLKDGQPSDNQVTTIGQPSDNQVTTIGQPSDNQVTTIGQPSDNQVTTNGIPRLGKVSIVKDSIGKDSINICVDSEESHDNKKPKNKFVAPTLKDVIDYCNERNNDIDAESFIDFYTSKNWMVGKNKMSDWRAAVRNWERNSKSKNNTNSNNSGTYKKTNKADELDEFYKMAQEWAKNEKG